LYVGEDPVELVKPRVGALVNAFMMFAALPPDARGDTRPAPPNCTRPGAALVVEIVIVVAGEVFPTVSVVSKLSVID
jgi:hypothetical protein